MKQECLIFESDLLNERYTVFCHESGLRIFVFPKKMSTTYALFATDYGSVDYALDQDGKRPLPDGVAHFLEHKLFANADGSDSFERFSELGADANAYTSHTRTVYLFSCVERFEEALAELIDFVTHPYFTKENVKAEQGIIGEEIRMCLDNPYDRCYYNMLKCLYHRHPVRRDICGSIASIASITPEILNDTYRTYYQLSNMVLIVCGDVVPEEVFALASAHLSKNVIAPLPPRRVFSEAATVYQSRMVETGQVAKPVFSIGIKDTDIPSDPVARLKKDAAMAILNEMLFSQSGELYTMLYEGGYISPEFSFEYTSTRDFAFNQLAGEADDPDCVLELIKEYIVEKQKCGLSEDDFLRCKRIEYAEYMKGFDSTEEIANNMLSFVFEGVELFSYPAVLDSISFSDIMTLLHTVFTPEAYVLSVISPEPNSKGECKV